MEKLLEGRQHGMQQCTSNMPASLVIQQENLQQLMNGNRGKSGFVLAGSQQDLTCAPSCKERSWGPAVTAGGE